CQREGNGVAGNQRRGSAAAMYFFHHRFELVALVDDGAQSLGLLGDVRRRFRLDADGVLGEELLLRGLELPLAAQLRKAAGDLSCSHGVLLVSLAVWRQRGRGPLTPAAG